VINIKITEDKGMNKTNESIVQSLVEIYERTKRNCLFYENSNQEKHLLNEIGCLRGVAYCLEEAGVCVHEDQDFLHMIAVAEKLKK
jgi:hypothetical protein